MSESNKGSTPEWNTTFEPLMKLLVGKHGVRKKDVVEVGKKKITVCRGKDIKELLLSEKAKRALKSSCSAAMSECLNGGSPSTENDVVLLGQELIRHGFISRVMDQPLPPRASQTDNSASNEGPSSEQKQKKKRWPDRVVKVAPSFQKFEVSSGAYYMISYEGSQTWNKVVLAAVIIGVIMLCMFSIWPIWAKLGAWYVLVSFSAFMVFISILRVILFMMLWVFGMDFWLFPNLNDEYLGVIDSFKPLYSFETRQDDKFMMICRVAATILFACAVYQIHQADITVRDFAEGTGQLFLDVVAWGEEKVTSGPIFEQKYKSIESIKEETAEAHEEDNVEVGVEESD